MTNKFQKFNARYKDVYLKLKIKQIIFNLYILIQLIYIDYSQLKNYICPNFCVYTHHSASNYLKTITYAVVLLLQNIFFSILNFSLYYFRLFLIRYYLYYLFITYFVSMLFISLVLHYLHIISFILLILPLFLYFLMFHIILLSLIS